MADAVQPACWTQARADAVLRSVALANDEADFLAVHQPIRDFQVTTTTGRGLEPRDDALLFELSDPDTRHAFCVVEGEPGAGKSHLIRWLSVKWPHDDLVMLVERADGSLTGTLKQLRDQLAPSYAHLFESLAQSVEASFEGRVRLFHSNLAHSLGRGFFEVPPADEAWCADWDLERLIGHPDVQSRWGGPGRILKVISGDNGRRNSASASFDLFDIADLAAVQASADGLSPKALMLLRRLKRECDRFAPARSQGTSAAELELDEALDIPESRRLLMALNARRNFAVQNILGISVDGLREMFLKLRRELLAEGRRLVLLLEDVTSWEGIDGQLIDSLVVDARARTDVCDLVSVVGMTPLYLKGIQGNYSGRISHVLRLGRPSATGGFQQTIQLAASEAQAAFAARYLRAARLDQNALDAWFRAGANPDQVPNACDACPRRPGCFAAFGDVDGIGLFPFNRNAISNMFALLEDPKATQSLQTPRGMIQGVLSPVLVYPDLVDAGSFPSPRIEDSEWMPARALQPSSFLRQVIDAVEPDATRRDQLRRVMALWSDRSGRITVTETPDGARSVSGVAEGVFHAFGLPWLGEDLTPPLSPPQPSPAPTPGAPPLPRAPAAPAPRPGPGPVAPPRPARPAPGPTRPRATALIEQARRWGDGETIGNPTAWDDVLTGLMAEAQNLLHDPHPGLWERIFTRDTVKLAGSGRTDTRHFVIPREPWAVRGLEAYLTIHSGEALQPTELESHRRAVARLLRRLASLASVQVTRRLGQEDVAWRIPGALAQVLLARAWLRGAVSPLAPLDEQFQELLSQEQDARSLPEARVPSWSETVSTTNYWHEKLREILRRTLVMPLGDGVPLMNGGAVAQSMAALRYSLSPDPVPTDADFPRGLEELAKLIELVRATDAQLRQIPDRELRSQNQLRQRALTLLRGTTLGHHLNRVDGAVEPIVNAFASAAPIQYAAYAQARSRVTDSGLTSEESPQWERLAAYLLDDPPTFASDAEKAEKLAYVLKAPLADLRQMLEVLDKAEAVVAAAYAHARAYVDAHQSQGDLTIVQSFGQRLTEAVQTLRDRLEEVDT